MLSAADNMQYTLMGCALYTGFHRRLTQVVQILGRRDAYGICRRNDNLPQYFLLFNYESY